MKRDSFKILKMDCPSEEQLIRMKLEPLFEVKKLDFDIPGRMLIVFHEGETNTIERSLSELNLNSKLLSSENTNEILPEVKSVSDKRLLWIVFAINSAFFIIELITGIIADSMGLAADSLDMLADAVVYGMSLMVLGSTLTRKKNVAKLSGIFQLTLAVFGLIEVVRRFFEADQSPDYVTMISVSVFALIGNGISLFLLQKAKSDEAHMQASYIFTSNDVIANIGVILAGIIVYFTNSVYPDLIIGTLVFLIVVRGAFRILKLSK